MWPLQTPHTQTPSASVGPWSPWVGRWQRRKAFLFKEYKTDQGKFSYLKIIWGVGEENYPKSLPLPQLSQQRRETFPPIISAVTLFSWVVYFQETGSFRRKHVAAGSPEELKHRNRMWWHSSSKLYHKKSQYLNELIIGHAPGNGSSNWLVSWSSVNCIYWCTIHSANSAATSHNSCWLGWRAPYVTGVDKRKIEALPSRISDQKLMK